MRSPFHWPCPSPVSTLSPVEAPALLDLKWLATTVNASPSLTKVWAIGSRALNQTASSTSPTESPTGWTTSLR